MAEKKEDMKIWWTIYLYLPIFDGDFPYIYIYMVVYQACSNAVYGESANPTGGRPDPGSQLFHL